MLVKLFATVEIGGKLHTFYDVVLVTMPILNDGTTGTYAVSDAGTHR